MESFLIRFNSFFVLLQKHWNFRLIEQKFSVNVKKERQRQSSKVEVFFLKVTSRCKRVSFLSTILPFSVGRFIWKV